MKKVFVKLANPNNSYSDIGQGLIISGPTAKEVNRSTTIAKGIEARALVELTQAEAEKHNASLGAKPTKAEAPKGADQPKKEGYEAMNYQELKKVAAEKGINSHGKKQAELLAELKALDEANTEEEDKNAGQEGDTNEESQEVIEYRKLLSEKTDDELIAGALEFELELDKEAGREAWIEALIAAKFPQG